MKRELNGSELVEFIQERQAKSVRGLRQQWAVEPRLAIIRTNPAPVVDSYMRMKQCYGDEILVDVDVHEIDQSGAISLIKQLNNDDSVHGIIVQLPLPDKAQTAEVLDTVAAHKDVDGLAEKSDYDAPTPVAISWLLAGYGVELKGKKILIVGNGRLVGAPTLEMFRSSGYDVQVADKSTEDLKAATLQADVIIAATGVAGLVTSDMVKPDVIVVDAGVSTDSNGLVGDVAQDVRDMPGVTITPLKGGVGPLTVSSLFENVITAARKMTGN